MTAVALLSGGVGGARAARGFAAILDPGDLTVIVNVGDDDRIYGLHVAADLDTVTYTLAGVEGPQGWGRAGDTFQAMEALAEIGVDTTFRLGDADLATSLHRTLALDRGEPLSAVTARIAAALGVEHRLLPASDDDIRTRVHTADGSELAFQEYFVIRSHRDPVVGLEYAGADSASPAPGVLDAVSGADFIVVAPSNPPLSIGPILAVPPIRSAVADHGRVVAVSPLFEGKAVKGPTAEVMSSLGYAPGNAGILDWYEGIIDRLVIDEADSADAELAGDVEISVTDTRIQARDDAARLASFILDLP
jgi:LPPG:FO 2-phospho-L-lactate transferase